MKKTGPNNRAGLKDTKHRTSSYRAAQNNATSRRRLPSHAFWAYAAHEGRTHQPVTLPTIRWLLRPGLQP
jgi:hypothetical protein